MKKAHNSRKENLFFHSFLFFMGIAVAVIASALDFNLMVTGLTLAVFSAIAIVGLSRNTSVA